MASLARRPHRKGGAFPGSCEYHPRHRRRGLGSRADPGIDLISVWQMTAADVFDIAFTKDRTDIKTLKDLEGKTVVLGDSGWSAIVDPMVAQAGGDPSLVKYTSSGPTWGQTLAAGQADAALSW